MSGVGHLARRFLGSLSNAEPSEVDVQWVRSVLSEGEWGLWAAMPVQDRRHSIEVARRFAASVPAATTADLAGALLHDVGKQVAALGTLGRVVATIVGPRTRRFREYHDHEALGAGLLAEAGSAPETVELVLGRGDRVAALRAADDV